jgi:hypothetical protein
MVFKCHIFSWVAGEDAGAVPAIFSEFASVAIITY